MDCINCVNCDNIKGFMCSCHYSYDTEDTHVQVGQYVPRNKANKCEFYSTEEYDRDDLFVL